MNKILLLVLGGSLGTLCRYFLAEWTLGRWGALWPYGTFAANMLGCLLMGLLLGIFEIRFSALTNVPVELRLLLMTGFLGAMTTFSSYELEALLYMRGGSWDKALVYLGVSIVAGLLVMVGGYRGVRLLAE